MKKEFKESYGGYGWNYKDIYPIISYENDEGMLVDIEGKKYYDWMSGCCSNPFGSYQPILDVINNQSKKLIAYYDYLHEERIKLTNNIVKYTSSNYKIMYSVTGSQAIELAIRFALYNRPNHNIYISKTGFHGYVFGTNKFCNRPERDIFYPDSVSVIPVTNIKEMSYGSIFIFEPYESANGGNKIRNIVELKEIIDYCLKNNILMIWDEVQTGMGRTGNLFVYQKLENYLPDILVTSKCISNGLPLSVVLFKETLKDWEGQAYSSTFSANPLAYAVGNKMFELLFQEDWLDKIKSMGNYLDGRLRYTFGFENAGSEGLYGYIRVSKNVLKECIDEGVILRYSNGNLLLTPKYTVTEKEIDKVIKILKRFYDF